VSAACQNRRMPRRTLALVLLLALGGWEPLRSLDPDVRAGNQAYAEGRYDDALAAYDRAAQRGGVDPHGLAFDRGTALVKKAQATQDAAERAQLMAQADAALKEAARSKDARLRADAHYNRGNAALGEGSLEKLGDAIEAYKEALRANPDHDNARVNLELALKKREKKRQQQQQQGGQGQQGQGQQGQGQQGQGQQGQGQQGQGQQGQGQQGQGQQGQGQQGQGQQGQGQQGQGQGQGSQQGQGQGQGSQQGQGQGQGSQQGQGQGQGSQQGQGSGQGSQQGQGSGQGSQDQGQGQGSQQQPPQDQDQGHGQGQGSGAPQRPGLTPGQGSQGQPDPGQLQQGPADPGPQGRPNQGRTAPKSPESPADQKLDDLETFSRRLQRDGARRRASGRSRDPQKDW